MSKNVKSQLIAHTDNHRRVYHLADSFRFCDDYFVDKAEVTKSSVKITGHQHLNLYEVEHHSSSTSSSGMHAYSPLKMTNTLERGIYTVIFQTFSYNAFDGSLLNDETLLQAVTGDHFKVLTFSHDWQSSSGGNSPHSKAYIQFSSDGQPGEIKFEIHYNYSSGFTVYHALKFLFYSRVLRGKHNDTFDHQLFDVTEIDYQGEH